MIKETEIIDIIKNYAGYTDRSMTEQCLHEVNFNLVAKEIVKKLTIPNVVKSFFCNNERSKDGKCFEQCGVCSEYASR